MAIQRIVLYPRDIELIQRAFHEHPQKVILDRGAIVGLDTPETRKEILLKIQNAPYQERRQFFSKVKYKTVEMDDVQKLIVGQVLQNYRVYSLLPDADVQSVDKLKVQILPALARTYAATAPTHDER